MNLIKKTFLAVFLLSIVIASIALFRAGNAGSFGSQESDLDGGKISESTVWASVKKFPQKDDETKNISLPKGSENDLAVDSEGRIAKELIPIDGEIFKNENVKFSDEAGLSTGLSWTKEGGQWAKKAARDEDRISELTRLLGKMEKLSYLREDNFRKSNSSSDIFRTVFYEQYYKGFRVDGGFFSIQTELGSDYFYKAEAELFLKPGQKLPDVLPDMPMEDVGKSVFQTVREHGYKKYDQMKTEELWSEGHLVFRVQVTVDGGFLIMDFDRLNFSGKPLKTAFKGFVT
ncbi:MAG: hypothetical protein HQK54_10980 [Oligoflexales bacterium]|nr:hypothetical protein [Oligoflexales bacterium]